MLRCVQTPYARSGAETVPPSGALEASRASTFVISITPFTASGGFDEAGIRRHLRRMATAGIGVYLGGGGSGEGYVLTSEEARRLLEIGVEELKGTVPVRAMGCEPRTAAEMIEYVAVAKQAGVEATQIYSLDPGHGHRPNRQEMQAYFEDVLSAIELPAVLSTHQSVGYRVPVEMLVGFAERYEHLIGINCTHQDTTYLAEIVDALGDRLDVHVGGPQQALVAWSLGATGYLSSEANFSPELCMDVVRAYREGDAAALSSSFGKLLRLFAALYGAGGIRATKGVLDRLGFAGGVPRKPQLPISADVIDRLVALIRQLGVIPV
jgi:4-hydroxy-tetrahydrodipicolinate synthase